MTELPTALREGLGTFGDFGREWADALPGRIERLRRRWGVEVAAPFEPGGVSSWVAPAGDGAVLKVVVPHREATHEAAALRAWDGDGAVRLLDDAPEEHAMLLERCRPGTALGDAGLSDDEVLDVGGDIAARLWRPVAMDAPYEPLADVMAEWADLVDERAATFDVPLDDALVAEGVALLRELAGTPDDGVLLHGDLHPANILAAEREPWLAIDAKPVTGDPAFDLPPLVLQTGDLLAADDPAADLARRLERVAAATGTDPDRIRAWGIARSVEMAVWFVAKGVPAGPLDAVAWAQLLAGRRR